jgi:hypothetical protein
MKQIHLYLWILGISIIAVAYILYNAPQEGFQVSPAQTSTNFWALSKKVDANDAPTITALARVSGPDPNDSNDTMPLTFSKYISIYAMAKYNSDLSGARSALFNNYNQLQTEMSTNLYDQAQVAAWSSDPINQTCRKLDTLRAGFITQYATTVSSMQDLSGTSILASAMRDENMTYQQQLIAKCQGTPLSPACIALANQEGPVFPLLAKYENVNNTLLLSEIDVSNNLQTINDTYSVLGCTNPNQFFVAPSSTQVYWINSNTKYPVSSCTPCTAAINGNICGTSPGPNQISDATMARIPIGAAFTCSMVASAQLQFLDTQTGTIDTTILRSKLQQLSPYYLSPDTLQYITTSIISAADSSTSIMTTSDTLIDLSNVIANIKNMTGTK